ncbi:FAD-dependent oxidoreductase [Martelella mediterranea]|uniref:FAD-dependent oxidoreductase n=1 Tax=Martelella mediterranea TaxID=293089 RepID=UPI001E3BAC17|nr:FAD-dependent oxidoreductase [Martelella mediterranea]MCD1636468.1 FAD-dependent oxidoreductase [Martelella mediterranea]
MVYDLAIIGGGINGAALMREAAARGAQVILLEKADFGSGSTSRSSRLLHCGLRYLAPGSSMSRFLTSPDQLTRALRTVQRSMRARNALVAERPHLLKPIRMTFPIYEGDTYRGWQIDAAFAVLRHFGRGGAPLDYRRYRPDRLGEALPFVDCLPKRKPLRHVIAYTEYQFDWPERLTVDMVLEAEMLGAEARNYCPVTAISETGDIWRLDTPEGAVEAKAVANLAGPWVDKVAGLEERAHPRMVNTTRGSHLVMQLGLEFRGHGVMTMSGLDHPFYCFPWRDRHFIGPTETASTENPDTVRPEAAEKAALLADLKGQLPGLDVDIGDTALGWAGLRPLTHEPRTMMAARNRVIHQLGRAGGPKFVALTNGSLGAHAITADDISDLLGLSRAQRREPPVVGPEISPNDTHVRHLADVVWRRRGRVWDADCGKADAASEVAALAGQLGWSAARIDEELWHFQRETAFFRYPGSDEVLPQEPLERPDSKRQ